MKREPYPYCLVDVFTTQPLEGNGLAVIPDARGLDADTMQRTAREFNQSETTFVFPAERGNAARVRIFTPTMELRFAGHPTLGTGFVLRERGIVSRETERFVLEEAIGDVPVRVDPERPGQADLLWLTTPPIAFGAIFRAQCSGIDAKRFLKWLQEVGHSIPSALFCNMFCLIARSILAPLPS